MSNGKDSFMKSLNNAAFDKALLVKNQFEEQAWASNQVLCGIDEVGRGCLAGPLVTAAVILPIFTSSDLLRDSKTMTEAQRLKAYSWIVTHAWWATGWVHHRIIDTYGIGQATSMAMKKAIMQVTATCASTPKAFVVDAVNLSLQDTSYAGVPVYSFCKGESLSSSIAAASIVAKVARDECMHRYNSIFPHYYFDKHKGYGTKQHCTILSSISQSLIHRKTFKYPLFYEEKKEVYDRGEQTVCRSD